MQEKENFTMQQPGVMLSTKAYAAQSHTSGLAPWHFNSRETGPQDVLIDIKFCGVCHTDIHFVRNDWGISLYPMVPGHEIVGVVSHVGDAVKGYKAGDLVGVGCMGRFLPCLRQLQRRPATVLPKRKHLYL
jgi:uncharacterized zinc-type alcohol dehydrogenase-like protein